jgi:hypothetical protein
LPDQWQKWLATDTKIYRNETKRFCSLDKPVTNEHCEHIITDLGTSEIQERQQISITCNNQYPLTSGS